MRRQSEDGGQRAEGGGRTMESAEGFRILHHFSQLPADAGANTLQLFLFEPIKITIVCRASKPVHRLLQFPICIRQLRQEVCRVTSFCPRFRNIGPNGSGRTANLINERKLLVIRPSFCFLENLFVQFAGQLINRQLFEAVNPLTHINSSVLRRLPSGVRLPPSAVRQSSNSASRLLAISCDKVLYTVAR